MKLLGNIKSKITKDEKSENVPHSEVTKVLLVHCNFVTSDYQQDLIVLYTVFLKNSFIQLLDFSPSNFI